MSIDQTSALPRIGPCDWCKEEIEYGQSYKVGQDTFYRHTECDEIQEGYDPDIDPPEGDA